MVVALPFGTRLRTSCGVTLIPSFDTGELYRVLAESAADAIVTIDEASTILSINPAGERLVGYPAAELVGQPLTRLMPERYRAAHRAGVSHFLATGERNIPWKGIELPLLTSAGLEIPVEISFGQFTSAGRRIFSGILRDVSDRRAAEAALAANAELLQSQAIELEQQIEEAQALSEELEQANQELHEANIALEQARADGERKAEELRAQEAEYRALANSIPTLAWMANPDGWIFWYNDRWYEYTGTVAAEMEGWGWQRVHDPVTLPEVLELWGRSINTGKPFEMTFPLRAADGSFRPFLTRVFPLRDEKDAVIRWFGTNTDVYHEHAARTAAERAANRMRQLQNLTALLARARTLDDVASVVVAEAAQATGASTAMLAMRDDATDEAVMYGETGLPEDLKADYERFPLTRDTPTAECIRTEAPIFIGARDGPDGLLARYPALHGIWESVGRSAVATVPLIIAGRAVGAMSFTFADPQDFSDDDREFFLTLAGQGAQAIERVDAFAAERRERQRSESIVESITDGFVTFDRDMRFTYVNARAATMFGVDRDGLLGKNVGTLPHGSSSPFVRLIRTVIDIREPRALEGFGTIVGRWLDLRAYPAEDGGAIAYFQDITERRFQQEERTRLLEEAQAANAAKSEFLRTVSHELRQPLNAIGGLLELWELGLRGALSEQQQLDLGRIKRNQRQLANLIEDLLSFARLEAGRLEVDLVPVPVNAVFDELTFAVAFDVEKRGLEYRCSRAKEPLAVTGDANRLHQVLVNLIGNAMKATPPGGRIDVRSSVADDVVHLHVEDTGSGIPPDKLEEIFIPFVQVGRALNQPREGAGLGLAISRGLAEAMGGTLTATSKLGAGSVFTVSLKMATS